MSNFVSASPYFSYFQSFLKKSLKTCKYENLIICITNLYVNVLCLTINLIPVLNLVF